LKETCQPGGGDLEFWNVIPDNNIRATFEASRTGYPYPPAALAESENRYLLGLNGYRILPGFRIPAGSRARLIAAITSIASPCSSRMYRALP